LELCLFGLRSLDGGFEEVEDVFPGRCKRSTNSISSSLLSRSNSSRLIPTVNHAAPPLLSEIRRGWVITLPNRYKCILASSAVNDSRHWDGSVKAQSLGSDEF
jgi:hypothetical protein